MNALKLLIIMIGGFSIFCAYMDYEWFFNHSKARTFVTLFGRGGARVFYVILGIVIMFLGLMPW